MRRVSVQLLCDLHEEAEIQATETVVYMVGGVTYEMDLCDEDNESFTKTMAHYVDSSRVAGSGDTSAPTRAAASAPKRSRRKAPSTVEADPVQIREWANANGYEVSGRGRIAGSVREAYAAAH